MRLVLFDIDGTLLRCGPQVRPLFLGALATVYGTCGSPAGFDFSGKTDPQIVLELLRRAGLSDAEILAQLGAMHELYAERLAAGLAREGMLLLPGVRELLTRLSARDDVALGLLTGNWQRCAQIKLSRFELDPFFAWGAFGDDAIDRRDLVPVALARARAAVGYPFTPAETLIIGDSLRDVDCAQAAGVPSLAVATGFTPRERLAAAGADWVFPDLAQAASEFALFAR